MRTITYNFVSRLVHTLLRLFFRRVEVTGLEHVPREGGGVLVSWHPNGMIDPALIFETFPRHVVFGARHGLFRVPGLGAVMRAVGTVPIYRRQDTRKMDPEARREANQRSLDALADGIARGSFSALFPEGVSHDAPHLQELKTGVARFYYRARQRLAAGAPPPVIVPVGLHYDDKDAFRSKVLVAYHPPLALPPELDVTPPEGEDEEVERARLRAFTEQVERALHEVVHATESWEVHHLMHRARKLIRAERAHRAGAELPPPDMAERTRAFARIWSGYYARKQTHPAQVAALVRKVAEYDADLRALQIEDHELDRPPALLRFGLVALLLLQVVLVYLLLPPLLLVGALVNAPGALILWGITRWAAKQEKDEASIQVMAGALIFPGIWALAGTLAGWGHGQLHAAYPAIPDTPVLAGAMVALLAFAGGGVALRYLRLVRETARAVRVRLTRERLRVTIARLKVDRSELHDALVAMADGLALPGSVTAEGRVAASLPPPAPAE